MSTVVSVQLLGGACLRTDGIPLGGPPAQRHRIALLALIVGSWPQPLSRDRAMALLWPERDAPSARRLLNLAVHVLRSALGEDVITSTGDALLWNSSRVRCDLHDLRVAMDARDAAEIVRLYSGPLLDGFHLSESAEFGYWLDAKRAELAHAYVGALHVVAARQESSGDAHGLVASCRRLVATDPYSSAHAMALMRALDAAGDRGAAIQHAHEHGQRLRDDLELEPDPEVLALAERLRGLLGARPDRRRRVAVLPFLDLSGDAAAASFADGVTEDIVAHLAKIRALHVIATTSVMGFRDRTRTLAEIARMLGAAILLDGSVRHVGERIRIVAKLIDVERDRHLWVETYDRELKDIFAIQTDVALHIARALETELSADEVRRIRREATTDVYAYHLYLRGRQSYIKFTPDGIRSAIESFESALARDPSFAHAAAALGTAYVELSENGGIPADIARVRARAATSRALHLDPDSSAAHCTMGHLEAVLELNWASAERSFQRAIELSPSNADAYALYGRVCAALGRYDQALALHARARELDPLAHRVDIVTTLLRAGRHEEAVALGEAARELDPHYARARATLGWAYFRSGRRSEGIAELERAVTLSPTETMWIAQLGLAYGLAGELGKARAIAVDVEARAKCGFVSPYHLAYVYCGLGELDSALDELERAVAERAGGAYGLKGSFLLTALHGHPRFEALLDQLKRGRLEADNQ